MRPQHTAKLQGVEAVQTLSRLKRIYPGKADTFVLDFVNTAQEMREEFAPFFQTTWTEETDANLLHHIQARITGQAVIDPMEQKTAVQAFLTANGQPKGVAHATVWGAINPAVARFGKLHEDDQQDFRDSLKAYTRAYASLGQVMGFADRDLESLFYYAKLLVEALPVPEEDVGGIDLGDTALQFIGGLAESGSLIADTNDGMVESFTGAGRGGQQDPIMVKLSELIESFNSRFSVDLGHADALMFFIELPVHLAADEGIQRTARDNTEEQFSESIKRTTLPAPSSSAKNAATSCSKSLPKDPRFAAEAMKHIRAETYRTARAEA